MERSYKSKQKKTIEKRPLYDAMNKYGIDHFSISQIDECSPEMAPTYEKYWIDKYRAYVGFEDSNGYNATLGGDGKCICNYSWILELWEHGYNNKEIQNITGYDCHTITRALENQGIKKDERKRRGLSYCKPIIMLDKETLQEIQSFPSANYAASYLNKPRQHIAEAAEGTRKTAYGYKWQYANEKQ